MPAKTPQLITCMVTSFVSPEMKPTSMTLRLHATLTPSGSSHSRVLVLLLQTVVLQVGQLFLTGSASTEQPLLLRFASEDLSSSELLFSPLPGQDHSQESEAWQARLVY